MASRKPFQYPRFQAFDANGDPLANGTVEFFDAGTTNNRDIYSDAGLTTTAPNPVTLNSRGEPESGGGSAIDIYLDSNPYKIVLKDSSGATVHTIDNYVADLVGPSDPQDPANATDSGTDTFQASLNADPTSGEVFQIDFQSANTTTTPTFENTAGSLGARTITTRDGNALWAGAVSGVHDVQYASGTDTYLVLEPIPTAANVNDAPVARDSNGRAKFADPSAAQDAATLNSIRSHIAGLVPRNNPTDADHDLDFTAGVATKTDGSDYVSVASLTKQFDAAFAEGNDAGGGNVLAADTTIHFFAIKKDSDGSADIFGDTDASGTNVPSGWTVIRRIVSLTTDGSSNLVPFSALECSGGGLEVLLSSRVEDYGDTNPGTSAVARAISVPSGTRVFAKHSVTLVDNTCVGLNSVLVSSLDTTDEEPDFATGIFNVSIPNINDTSGASAGTSDLLVRTNSSAQIRTRVEGSDSDVVIKGTTHGWIDPRRT